MVYTVVPCWGNIMIQPLYPSCITELVRFLSRPDLAPPLTNAMWKSHAHVKFNSSYFFGRQLNTTSNSCCRIAALSILSMLDVVGRIWVVRGGKVGGGWLNQLRGGWRTD